MGGEYHCGTDDGIWHENAARMQSTSFALQRCQTNAAACKGTFAHFWLFFPQAGSEPWLLQPRLKIRHLRRRPMHEQGLPLDCIV
jgi:hypothetical protein